MSFPVPNSWKLLFASDNISEDMTKKYGQLIDNVIYRCESTAGNSESGSCAIRKHAAISCMKAAYFRNFKKELIQKMNEQGIEPIPYKVNQFLNDSFFSVVRGKSDIDQS